MSLLPSLLGVKPAPGAHGGYTATVSSTPFVYSSGLGCPMALELVGSMKGPLLEMPSLFSEDEWFTAGLRCLSYGASWSWWMSSQRESLGFPGSSLSGASASSNIPQANCSEPLSGSKASGMDLDLLPTLFLLLSLPIVHPEPQVSVCKLSSFLSFP